MDQLAHKHSQLTQALKTLESAVSDLRDLEARGEHFNPRVDYDTQYRTSRDSMIQRFEYTIDLFWKYLKAYLEHADVIMQIKLPREVIRQAFAVGVVGENEAQLILEMIKSRNETSHIYVEEIAEQLAHAIPKFYTVLNNIVHRMV